MKKTSSLMTLGGIMAAFGTGLIGVPQLVLQTYAVVIKDGPPHWFTVMILPMLLVGILLTTLGTAILGVAGKGSDDHSTQAQVMASSKQAEVTQKVLDADAVAKPEAPTKVMVEPPPPKG